MSSNGNSKLIIRRYFDDCYFKQVKEDFRFLIKLIKNFKWEFELAIRNNYFNLYNRGNSALKIAVKHNHKYEIYIRNKFFSKMIEKDERFKNWKKYNGYYKIIIESNRLHSLLQKKYLTKIASKIKEINYSEELSFEQMLITDNCDNEKLIIIDRQIVDKKIDGRIDLLALKQKNNTNNYNFLVIEIKMGNSPDLKEDVVEQIKGYTSHIENYFDDYKNCYEIQYSQKKKLGLIEKPTFNKINILKGISSLIVVGGYSGVAKDKIENLKNKNPDLNIKQFTFKFNDL